MTKYVLSVDGGGIRGIIPAKVLEEIEKRSGRPISEIFDLMAGTSTGGLIVAGLCKKNVNGGPQFTASDLVKLYVDYGRDIFHSTFIRQSVTSWVHSSKYPSSNIESLLYQFFDDTTLGDILSNVLITSYDIKNSIPFFFKSWHQDTKPVKLADVCRATTAAPTYFEPKRLTVNGKERLLIDGGVFANNPAACAYASSKKLFPNEDILILSLGTGRVIVKIAEKKRGSFAWLNPLLKVMYEASLDLVNYQLGNIMGEKYIRIQSQIKVGSSKLDNIKPQNIEYLFEEAIKVISQNQEAIDMISSVKREIGDT